VLAPFRPAIENRFELALIVAASQRQHLDMLGADTPTRFSRAGRNRPVRF
jgi:hypothetical protein